MNKAATAAAAVLLGVLLSGCGGGKSDKSAETVAAEFCRALIAGDFTVASHYVSDLDTTPFFERWPDLRADAAAMVEPRMEVVMAEPGRSATLTLAGSAVPAAPGTGDTESTTNTPAPAYAPQLMFRLVFADDRWWVRLL